jgi:predicted hydrocarbon binding protein
MIGLPIALLMWLVICVVIYGVSAQGESETLMRNCGHPEGLTVQPSGRVIQADEVFTIIGYESVDAAGVSSVQVYDGVISGEELFICEVADG